MCYFKIVARGLNVEPTTVFLNEFDTVKGFLGSLLRNSAKSYLAGLTTIVKTCNLPTELHNKYKDLSCEYRKEPVEYKKPDPKKVEQIGSFKYDGIAETRDKVRAIIESQKDSKINSTWYQWIITCFYSRIEPLRTQDYINTKLVFENNDNINNSTDTNYLNFINNTLVINIYKTDEAYGQRNIAIPTELIDEIKLFIAKTNQSIWLFPQITDKTKTINKDQFSVYCKKVFGVGITPSTLRSLFVSQILPTKSAEERQQIAGIMGHSITTQNITYSQYNNILHPEVCSITDTDSIDNTIVENNDMFKISTDLIKHIHISEDIIGRIQFQVKDGILTITSAI
jgi:hypothetical protein